MKEFFSKNKVFILGLLQFVITTFTELTADENGHYNVYIIGYSFVIAVLTYFGNNLRGQWASISSSLLSTAMVFGSLHDSGTPITLAIVATKILMPLSLALLGIFYSTPPKSRDYEHSEVIQTAKAEAKIITEAKKVDSTTIVA